METPTRKGKEGKMLEIPRKNKVQKILKGKKHKGKMLSIPHIQRNHKIMQVVQITKEENRKMMLIQRISGLKARKP